MMHAPRDEPRRPLRVLHISSTYPPTVIGGAEKVVAQLAEAQAASGMQVAAAYLTRDAQPMGECHGVGTLPQRDRNLIWMQEVMQRPRAMRTANKLWQAVNLRAADDFADAIAVVRPDIVHTHSMVELPPFIWTRAKASGAKLVHTLHDYDLICSRATLFRDGHVCTASHMSCRLLGGWKGRFAGVIDAVVAVSAPVLAAHRARGLFAKLDERRARVIWNAVPDSGTPMPKRVPRTGPMIFGFLGRVVPEKGIGTLLAACRELPAEGWRLRIGGRTPEGAERFEAQAEGMPVEFLGFVDPEAFLDSIDILVVPSLWREPFGLTVVEAFARRVPVMGADHGAIAELVGSVGREWLTPPGNATALAAKMASAIRAGREALPPASAFATVVEAASSQRMRDSYAALYAELLAPPREHQGEIHAHPASQHALPAPYRRRGGAFGRAAGGEPGRRGA